MKAKWFWIIFIILSLYFFIFSVEKIDFLTADIGRHVKNGEIFLHSSAFGVSKSALLHTNLFSYTHGDFPFINHHWGSGVLAYLIFYVAGWDGISLVYVLLLLCALLCAFWTVREDADASPMFLVGLFLIPLVADRLEVRPEAISYFFISIFICLLYQFSRNKISYKFLYCIPLIELLWSNMHIYFIFGPFLVGVFLFESLVKQEWEHAKKLGIILVFTTLVTLLTPYGIAGALYPFTIFQNYGYRVVENQSIFFLEKLNFMNPSFLWYKITILGIFASSFFIYIHRKKDSAIALTIISFTFAILAFFGIRHMTAFAFVSLPLLIYNFSTIKKYFGDKLKTELGMVFYIVLTIVIIVSTFGHFADRLAWNRNFGLGLLPGAFDSSEFILQNNIKGPVFNNYDIGGAMIYSLFPREKVFVDNRPEAYPATFFQNTYIPMQKEDTVWRHMDAQYNFNAIYFYRLDKTPWAQKFLIQMVTNDTEWNTWAPVYVDAETIIFLKRNNQNKKTISEYEIPRNMFTEH